MSQPGFALYDDAQARVVEPFALTRPFGELRVGGMLLRQRWERVLGRRALGFIAAPHLAAFQEFDSPRAATDELPTGTVIVNSRFAPALDARVAALKPGHALSSGGTVVAVALVRAMGARVLSAGTTTLDSLVAAPAGELPGWWLTESWDAIRLLPAMLAADARVLAGAIADEPPAQVAVLGEHRFAAARGSYVEPQVVVDTTHGDVVVETGARIAAFTRLAGPCVIGAHTLVAGGRITCCSIGEHARVSGEMSVCIVIGHSSKAHDGFVGHSMIGRWVNVGAGTTTSNLKNSYGGVRVRTARGELDTGMQFLGSLIGDHAKLAIGTRLTTGSVVGAGANVFGDHTPDKRVPPFAWGDRSPFGEYALDKFLVVAEHVMQRRDVALTGGMREMLAVAWESVRGKKPARAKGAPKSRRHL
jgi:UDP-N-acetylglucosamine diphosphorylase/glucosamine-1-phosphate N-acetyltransferase